MRIAFYTFGSHEIGLGHVYRSLALAREIKQEWPLGDFEWLIQSDVVTLEILGQSGFGHIRILTDGELPSGGWDLLVVDRLEVDPLDMMALKKRCRCLISIDDVGQGSRYCDIAFHTLYCPLEKSHPATDGVLYSGLEFVVINPDFVEHRQSPKDLVENLLVTQGGADTHGKIPVIVSQLVTWVEKHPRIRVHVHCGPANLHFEEIIAILGGGHPRFTVHHNVANLPKLVSQMDLAISGGGILACEIAALGVPVIVVTAEQKELETAQALSDAGCAVNCGLICENEFSFLLETLDHLIMHRDFRFRLSENSRKLFDGLAGKRMVKLIKECLLPLAALPGISHQVASSQSHNLKARVEG